jgi:AraC-like DNA-binding protein
VALQIYEKAARALGIDPFRQMRQAGLVCEEPVPDDVFVSRAVVARLLEETAAATDSPDFGLRMAQCSDSFFEGPLVLLMRHASTLGEAIDLLTRYVYVYDQDGRPRMEAVPESSDEVDLVIDIRGADRAREVQITEYTLGALVRILRHVQGHAHDDWELRFAHPAAAAPEVYRHYLGSRVRFDMPFSGIRLPAADLARPLPARNELRMRMAISYIEAHYRAAGESVAGRVRRLLRERLGTGQVMQADIAAALAVHEKTLQRRLAREGRAFPALLDEVRREVFLECLRRPARPGLAQIALMLGYSEQAALSRSCQRWFGCPPSEVLRRQQAAAGAAAAPQRDAATAAG